MAGLDMQSLLNGPLAGNAGPFQIPNPANVHFPPPQTGSVLRQSLGQTAEGIWNALRPANLDSALTGGLISPQTLSAGAQNVGNFISGAPMVPLTNQDRAVSTIRLELDRLDQQISATRASGADTTHLEQLRRMLQGRFVDAVSGKFPAQGQSSVAGTGAGTGSGAGTVTPAPAQAPPAPGPLQFQVPQVPTPQIAAYPSTAAPAAPTFGADVNPQTDMLSGLAAGASEVSPMASPAELLFKMGMGALGGFEHGKQRKGAQSRTRAAAENKYREFLSTFKGRQAQAKALYKLRAQGLMERAAAVNAAHAPKPLSVGNTVLIPSTHGNTVTYTPHTVNAGASQAAVTPQQVYNVLLGESGGPQNLMKIAATMDPAMAGKLQAEGISKQALSQAIIANVVDKLRQTSPALYEEAVKRAAMVNSLNKRK